jgi:N-acetylmuramoyl-L-alanine amidase
MNTLKQLLLKQLLFLGLWCSLVQAQSNVVTHLFHHKNEEKTQLNSNLEWATIMLYFQYKPTITVESCGLTQETHRACITFKCANSTLGGDIKIKELHHHHDEFLYKGIVYSSGNDSFFKFTYDPKKIYVMHEECMLNDGKRYGLVIRLFNKHLLTSLSQERSLLRMAYGKKKPIVVVDPGHGGHDTGSQGPNALEEKNINLTLAHLLAKELKAHGITPILTRTDDSFIPLDHRTAYARPYKADLLVSLHANWAPSNKVEGIETYYVNQDLFFNSKKNDALDMPARAMLDKKYALSKECAKNIHTAMLTAARAYYEVKDRGIKSAALQVLVGASIPAILIEVGFISHTYEAQLLQKREYLAHLATYCARAIVQCMQKE